jgi:hypothetical protein
MPTPASSIKFLIYGPGEDPRELTVYYPNQNIQFADTVPNSNEVAIGVQNLPDSPVRVDFPTEADRLGFLDALRTGLYDWDPTIGPVLAWPEGTGTSSAGASMVLSNLPSGVEVVPTTTTTTTEAPETTDTTEAGAIYYTTTVNWILDKSIAMGATGTLKLYKNNTLQQTINVGSSFPTLTGTFTMQNAENSMPIIGAEFTNVPSTYDLGLSLKRGSTLIGIIEQGPGPTLDIVREGTVNVNYTYTLTATVSEQLDIGGLTGP